MREIYVNILLLFVLSYENIPNWFPTPVWPHLHTHWLYVCRCVSGRGSDPCISNILNQIVDFDMDCSQSQKDQSVMKTAVL